MKRLSAFLAAIALGSGVAAAAAVFVPSGIMAHPASFDRKNVTVLGTVTNLLVRPAGGGTVFTQFQLCDSICINAISPGPPKVTNGTSATITGTFHIFYAQGPIQAHDLLLSP